jgi:hypothetical protein
MCPEITLTKITSAFYLVSKEVSLTTNFRNFHKLTSSMASTLGTVEETTKNMTEAAVYDNPDDRPVKSSKRAASDRLKTGRASTHPVVLDPAAKRARRLNEDLLPPT